MPPTGALKDIGPDSGDLPVELRNRVSDAYDLFFIQQVQPPTTLAVAALKTEYTIEVVDSTGYVNGTYIGIVSASTGLFYFGTQIGAPVGNIITLDTQICCDFSPGETVLNTTREMNVDGSTTPQIFQIGPFNPVTALEVDITRIMGVITNSVAMDDGTFGGLDALTRGLAIRRNDSVITNYWNVKTNGDLALICFDAQYTDRAPGGENGFRFRNSYAGLEKHGVAIRIGPSETLEVIVQDDLTGNSSMRMMAQGCRVTT